MLQRTAVILAVTAASYGLQVPQPAQRWSARSAAADFPRAPAPGLGLSLNAPARPRTPDFP
ncbi:hypothetical protein [Ramlibacter rhizophilus]|nr:hypothetical protein [Ramlibacter rhizophilus]